MEKGGAARHTSSGQRTGRGQPRVEDWQVSEIPPYCKKVMEEVIRGQDHWLTLKLAPGNQGPLTPIPYPLSPVLGIFILPM